MAVQRRFLLASSVARLLRKERGVSTRLVEAHFQPRPERMQLVRVEREHSFLVLRTRSSAGEVQEEQVEVPLSQAEALVEVAAGTVAFDRMSLPLGGEVEAVLDRFIIPHGLDLLTVTIASEPQAFAPLLWFGTEVTGNTAYETSALALEGLPAFEEVEVTNAAFEALLDTLGGRTPFRFREQAPQTVSSPETQRRVPVSLEEGTSSRQPASISDAQDTGEPANQQEQHHSALQAIPNAADAESNAGLHPQPKLNEVTEQEARSSAHHDPQIVREIAEADSDTGQDRQEAAGLPHVEAGPRVAPQEPAPQRRPLFRPNVEQLDAGIARLARSLAPKGPRSTQ